MSPFQGLRQLLGRKKGTAFVATVIGLVLNDVFKLGVDRETVWLIAGTAMSFILGQGVADIGKEKRA